MNEPAWKAQKAHFDALDDGDGPYTCWAVVDAPTKALRQQWWRDFLAWAYDHLGQGFSLACSEGYVIDPITSATFHGYCAGRMKGEGNGIVDSSTAKIVLSFDDKSTSTSKD